GRRRPGDRTAPRIAVLGAGPGPKPCYEHRFDLVLRRVRVLAAKLGAPHGLAQLAEVEGRPQALGESLGGIAGHDASVKRLLGMKAPENPGWSSGSFTGEGERAAPRVASRPQFWTSARTCREEELIGHEVRHSQLILDRPPRSGRGLRGRQGEGAVGGTAWLH